MTRAMSRTKSRERTRAMSRTRSWPNFLITQKYQLWLQPSCMNQMCYVLQAIFSLSLNMLFFWFYTHFRNILIILGHNLAKQLTFKLQYMAHKLGHAWIKHNCCINHSFSFFFDKKKGENEGKISKQNFFKTLIDNHNLVLG